MRETRIYETGNSVETSHSIISGRRNGPVAEYGKGLKAMAIDFSPTAVQKKMGIQRRRGHGVMETIDTMPAHGMAG